MKIYAICLVKNEDDVIAQTLTHAARFCNRIFVIDNGSTDETWDIVRSLPAKYPQIVPFAQIAEPYDEGMRWLAYSAHHRELSDRDWWLILDADELLAEDPRPVIASTVREEADVIHAWQVQFYYTEKDFADWQAGRDTRDAPIYERRRYYRIDWQEPRLFRNQTASGIVFRQSKLLTDTSPHGHSIARIRGKLAKRRIFNRHFQYRDPPQITKRLELRYGRPEFAAQVKSLDWRTLMRASRDLHYYRDGERLRFTAAGLMHCYAGWLRYVFRSRYGRLRERVGGLTGLSQG